MCFSIESVALPRTCKDGRWRDDTGRVAEETGSAGEYGLINGIYMAYIYIYIIHIYHIYHIYHTYISYIYIIYIYHIYIYISYIYIYIYHIYIYGIFGFMESIFVAYNVGKPMS